jgi:hypothetical protein
MLRFALLVLIVANAGYFAWAHGWMATLGFAPEVQSEPFRLKQQVRPEVLTIAPHVPATPLTESATPHPTAPADAASTQPAITTTASDRTPEPAATPDLSTAAATTPAEPTVCLQTDSLDTAQAQRLQQALYQSALPDDSWQVADTAISGRWMVYVGKFANEMALEKRRAELRSRKIAYDRAGGHLEPGLSLGRFSTEEAANRELARITNQDVRGARVVQERAPHTVHTVRLPGITAEQRQRLQALGLTKGPAALRTCPANG